MDVFIKAQILKKQPNEISLSSDIVLSSIYSVYILHISEVLCSF